MVLLDRRAKAERMAEAASDVRRFRRRGVTFECSPPAVTDAGLLRVDVRATRGGDALPTNNPYYFGNPPLGDDPRASFCDMVADAVLGPGNAP